MPNDEIFEKLKAAYGGGDTKDTKKKSPAVIHGEEVDGEVEEEYFEPHIPLHVVNMAMAGALAKGLRKGKKAAASEAEEKKAKTEKQETWQHALFNLISLDGLDWDQAPPLLRQRPARSSEPSLKTYVRGRLNRLAVAFGDAVKEEIKRRMGGSSTPDKPE